MRRSTGLALLFAGGVIAASGVAVPAQAAVRSAPARTVAAGDPKTDIDKILTDSRLNGATVGVTVRNAETGAVLYTHNADQQVVPASNNKLETSAAAFGILGTGYRFRTDVSSRGGKLYLRGTGDPKMSEPLAIVWSRPLPEGAEPSTVTVSKDAAGRWFAAILIEEKIRPLDPAADRVGVDAGITALITLSTGEKVTNPKHERSDRRRLAKAQRALARKAKGSSNRAKARLKVAKVYARIADRRRDHLHKLTTRLVRENQTVVIEDLTVRNMVKNHSLARAISDASWRDLRSMLEYKAAWYGRELVVIDRWFPSSKLCSACGTPQNAMPLNIRQWKCACGASHDRDVNAAKNILAAGLAER